MGIGPQGAVSWMAKRLSNADIEPDRVSALIIEPVQGEVYRADELLQALRPLCDEPGIE